MIALGVDAGPGTAAQSGGAGGNAGPALADQRRTAGQAATAAVVGIGLQVHAGIEAQGLPGRAARLARTRRTYFVGAAGVVARPAMKRVAAGIDASAPAITAAGWATSGASSTGTDRTRQAGVAAGTAVLGIAG